MGAESRGQNIKVKKKEFVHKETHDTNLNLDLGPYSQFDYVSEMCLQHFEINRPYKVQNVLGLPWQTAEETATVDVGIVECICDKGR